ncbi:MAG: bifunctional 4-hydroxy-2-oxoglutarate aldolase/2-dehydro-3-deoxy-phosphogluconate aldolase [Sphaerochaeta sp.]|jgi:2-dehydro-3-deoxyphosphogluconate aldolase/(4S)-4-hydroxy-2-oxoglutarate aldolase|nr:bifunctional 4-hydroxy-2-oxoglutarate aldolase/2-dehydro-3-deoxy-phosphogluconate aldolase [Sphaerochaeta sp.]MCH3919633.1 bifunctional 4-hydroxy-2-oxoglutarate aldolase/2-dehydro-3-deoxy-phosphogluconate aldolase [Sphaerochaeta sp.]MCI2044834.1 bifunctional 4-hydroxy-2-oxoglutarate aldolase/2-dehydro-3-deoxy-phosphogluconate aldolase [Sphaerochaeta sp.]MCI2075929.1 bifunctional 4-hydroxy-2-oxoglutarate aldolase/2-dehydro-3-deoxy-phosphogluconate aldolase [Sphaerochaeta sp.]MCI2097304.1 bifu
MFEDFYKRVHDIGIIPVVKLDDASKATKLAKALIDGGIPAAEVTFRTSAAEAAIKAMHQAYPDMLLGAGTVLSIENAEKAVKAGASFIVAPGFDEELVSWCLEHHIPVCPGVSTPSEITKGVKMGLSVLKFFPAEANGGVDMLKNLAGPFPSLKFMPTGGINLENIASYAKAPNVLSVGGSWMVKSDLINGDKWDEITTICKEAELALQGLHFTHIGLNNPDAAAMEKSITAFEHLGMVCTKRGAGSSFMDTTIEVMNKPFYGTHGHIAYSCFDVDRTIGYLKQFGFTPISESIVSDAKGTKVVYFKEEVNGFAIHLVRA